MVKRDRSTPVTPYQPLAEVYQSRALKLGMNQPAVRNHDRRFKFHKRRQLFYWQGGPASVRKVRSADNVIQIAIEVSQSSLLARDLHKKECFRKRRPPKPGLPSRQAVMRRSSLPLTKFDTADLLLLSTHKVI